MNGNLIIVDDDSGALKLLKEILTAEGYQVRPFNNSELALRSIVAEMPELILLDIRMPGMDGFEVCWRIKQNEQLKDIPVIFISAATEVEDKVRAFQAGGVDYITKPFQKEEIVARAKTHVTLSRSMKELKRIAEDLHRSEESLKMAQTIAHLGHWELDVKNGQFICSEEMCRILEIDSEKHQVNYGTFLQVVHPDDRERVGAHLNQIIGGCEFNIEFRILLSNGRIRVVQGIGKDVSSSSSKPPKIIGTIQELSVLEQKKMLGIVQDITERKELELKLEQEANTDFLTGCASRRHFMELCEQEFMRIRRYGGQLSVLMLDLDHFKLVNDEHGHPAGDQVLKKLVGICHVVLREVDVVGRLGGEEFCILLPKTGCEKVFEIAERLRRAIDAAEVLLENGSAVHFTVSIGVAFLETGDSNINMILGRADQGLYRAKNSGRNRVCAGI